MGVPDPPKNPEPVAGTPASSPPTLDYLAPPAPKTWKCGTLTYTRWGLVNLFVWMLWGDLIFTLVEAVYPNSIPFQLERLQYPKAVMAIASSTLSYAMSTVMVPFLSFRSDRTRTRFGRRIPYIVTTMIPLAICLAALGFSDDIGASIRSSGGLSRFGISPLWTIIIVMGLLMILFDFFHTFLGTTYWYLFADVIPSELMGRFNGLFKMVGILGGGCFSYFVRPHIETDTRLIYLGAAALYLFGFGLMCWRVKEGEYPPPRDEGPRAAWYIRLGRMVKLYAAECYSQPVYLCFYAFGALWQVGNACMLFVGFYYVRYLHITQEQIGHFGTAVAPIPFLLALPFGWFIDKIHPLRSCLLGALLIIPCSFAGSFIDSFFFYMIFIAIRTPLMVFFDVGTMPLFVKLFPRKQFGQFSSANALVRSVTYIGASIAGGFFMQYFDNRIGSKAGAFAWIWMGFFQTLGLACLTITYFYWKKYGAEKFAYDAEKRALVSIP